MSDNITLYSPPSLAGCIHKMILASDQTPCLQIWRNLDTARYGLKIIWSLWNLTCVYTAQQCCQCTCRVKQFSMQLRDFARSCVETTVHFVNRGPDVWLYTDGVSVVGMMLLSQVTFLGAKEHMIQVTPYTDTESISITQGWFKVCAEPMRDGVTL